MELIFHVVDASHILEVDAAGRIDLPSSLRAAQQIAAFDGKARELPVLLDVRGLSGALGTLDTVRLVESLLTEARRYRRKVALLARRDDQFGRAQLMQNYSSNRGLPYSAFTDHDEAVAWLQRD